MSDSRRMVLATVEAGAVPMGERCYHPCGCEMERVEGYCHFKAVARCRHHSSLSIGIPEQFAKWAIVHTTGLRSSYSASARHHRRWLRQLAIADSVSIPTTRKSAEFALKRDASKR